MPQKLEELAKEITIEDIAKMNPLDRCKYYSFEWVFNTVWWPGWIGGPVGTLANVAIMGSKNCDSYQSMDRSIPLILGTFLGGAMIASAVRVGYNILRDGRIIKKIKDGTYDPEKSRR